MTITNHNLPAIPNENIFKYKHYYIVQDKKFKGTYHLYLFEYEPSTLFLSNTGFIRAKQKYGYIIEIGHYKYDGTRDNWGVSSNSTTSYNYADLTDSLIYNNFTMHIEDDCYEKNPMPNDQLAESVIPPFPPVPYCDLSMYKHYMVTQRKERFDTFYLYLFKYEPVSFRLNSSGRMVAYQQYGEYMPFLTYTFRLGDTGWAGGGINNTLMTFEDLADTLMYNNFEIKVGDKYFIKNTMPDDNIIPTPSFKFPPVPKIINEEQDFRHYALIQNPTSLEKFTLYILKDEPVDYMLNSNKTTVHFKNKSGGIITMRTCPFKIGDADWGYLGVNNSIPISTFNKSGLYNNFKIEVFDTEESTKSLARTTAEKCICKADIRIHANDGVSNSSGTTEWVECTNGWYYYNEGQMHHEWLELKGKTYFMDGEKNWLRVENEFKKIRESTYYFGEGGVMVTGPGHYINGTIYNFDIYGRLISTGWDNRTEDYFVINQQSHFRIRSSTSEKDESNVIKTLAPGRGLKVVLPLNEVKIGETIWIEVYTDKTKNQTGWGNKSNIYPDLPIEHLFLEHPTRDYRDITGYFKEFNEDGAMKETYKTLDYVKNWGAPGQGKQYPEYQNKDERGRFKVAVAPKILYPDYPRFGEVISDDFNGFSKDISVYLKNIKGGSDLKVLCVVSDLKAHSFDHYPYSHDQSPLHKDTEGYVDIPDGLIQTGIAYPKSDNAKYSLACSSEHMNGTIVEFCSHVVEDFNCKDFELIKIVSNENKHEQY